MQDNPPVRTISLESTLVGFSSGQSPYGLQLDCSVQWTPVDFFSHRQSRYKLAVKKVDWSPVESSGVHMEYGGDCKDLDFLEKFSKVLSFSRERGWHSQLLLGDNKSIAGSSFDSTMSESLDS